jgi:hypothetical protein
MTSKLFVSLSAVVGVVTGFVTIHSPLASSWLSIFLWIVVGIAIVFFSTNRRTALWAGATFGFFNIASWLISGFRGASDKIGGFLVLTLLFSLLGAMCGLLGGYIFSNFFKNPHST